MHWCSVNSIRKKKVNCFDFDNVLLLNTVLNKNNAQYYEWNPLSIYGTYWLKRYNKKGDSDWFCVDIALVIMEVLKKQIHRQ